MDERYNIFHKRLITTDEGEMFCPKCRGKGRIISYNGYRAKRNSLVCDKCLGDGKIDWIEKATGKNNAYSGSYIGPK